MGRLALVGPVLALLIGCGDLADRLDAAAGRLDQAADTVTTESDRLADEGRAALSEAATGAPVSQLMAPGSVAVLDGDTIRFEGVRYRLRAADAPETVEPHCPEEAAAGAAATDWLRAWIGEAHSVEARGFGPDWVLDRYRRRLAYVLVDGQDLGERLIAAGHGARRGRGNWCEGPG